MRRALILALLVASMGYGQTLIAHTATFVSSGAVTSAAINTTGASIIYFATASTFGPGAISDSKGNTWSDNAASLVVHNTSGHIFTCNLPCNVGTSHTFSIANNGSGFNQGLVIGAFDQVVQISNDWRDTNVNSGNKLAVTNHSDSLPPFTIQATQAWKPTAPTVLMIAECISEQGAGGASTIDSSMVQVDHTFDITLFYLLVSNPGVNFNPTCTVPSDALHSGIQMQAFLGPGSGISGFPKHKVSAWR